MRDYIIDPSEELTMPEPKSDHEQLLDDLNADEVHTGVSISMAWIIGACCLLLGFISGHLAL
jgi:hypothetical protein